jgi:hypothetical protein
MNQLLLKIAFIAWLCAISTVTFAHNNEPKDPKKVSVIVDQQKPGYATLSWVDIEITSVEIHSSNGQFLPTIPVMDATSLHLNGLIEGNYEISFLIGNKVVATEYLTVKN